MIMAATAPISNDKNSLRCIKSENYIHRKLLKMNPVDEHDQMDLDCFVHVHTLINQLDISNKKLSEILHVSTRTINRNLNENFAMGIDKVEKLLGLYRLIIHGIDVFGSKKKFSKWINKRNVLFDAKPIDMLVTMQGLQMVDDTIGRIEYGVFA